MGPTEYVFELEDGSKKYEIVSEQKEIFMFKKMHNAKSAYPVSLETNSAYSQDVSL